jgi:hypothetical protein
MAPRGAYSSRGVKAVFRLGALALVVVVIAKLSRGGCTCDCGHHHLSQLSDTSSSSGSGSGGAGAGENAELRARLDDALEEVERLKKSAGAGGGGGGHHWWSPHHSSPSHAHASAAAAAAGASPAINKDAICTGAVVEKSAKLKIAQLRSQLGEERGSAVGGAVQVANPEAKQQEKRGRNT